MIYFLLIFSPIFQFSTLTVLLLLYFMFPTSEVFEASNPMHWKGNKIYLEESLETSIHR